MSRYYAMDFVTLVQSRFDRVWDEAVLPAYLIGIKKSGVLEVTRGTQPESVMTFCPLRGKPLTFGRSSKAHVWIPEYCTPGRYVSRHHGEFSYDASKGWSYVDSGGTNGTFLNGEQVPVRKPVALGWDNITLHVGLARNEPREYALEVVLQTIPDELFERDGMPMDERRKTVRKLLYRQ